MDSPGHIAMKFISRLRLATFVVSVSLFGVTCGSSLAQDPDADADIQLQGDGAQSQTRSIVANAGDNVTFEIFATGLSNTVGLTANFTMSDAGAVTEITGERQLGYDSPPNPVTWDGSENFTFNESTESVFDEDNTGALKLAGLVHLRLSAFTSLAVSLNDVVLSFQDGSETTIPLNIPFVIFSPGNIPKAFDADLKRGSLINDSVHQRRVNPGARIGAHIFLGGITEATEIEIQAQLDREQILGGYTLFFPRAPFRVVVPELPAAPVSDESRASVSFLPSATKEVEARGGGGQTVRIGLDATGFSNTVGLTFTFALDKRFALADVTGEKGQGYDFPPNPVSWQLNTKEIVFDQGTVSAFDEGEPLNVLKRVGSLDLLLKDEFRTFTITLTSVKFSFQDGSEEVVTPNVRLVVNRRGTAIENVDQTTIRLRLTVPESASQVPPANALAGSIWFLARDQFRGTQITFSEVTFTDPADVLASETIFPDVTLVIDSWVTDVPVATVRPAAEAVTDTRAVITGEFDKPGIVTVVYSEDPNNLDRSVELVDEMTRFRLVIEGLTPGTRYFFQAKSLSAQGESDFYPSTTALFVTKNQDTRPPRILEGPGLLGRTQTEVRIGFELDEAATSQIAYGAAADALDTSAAGPADPTKSHEVVVSGLNPGEEVFYRVTVTDLNNNAFESTVLSFRTLDAVDTRPLEVLGRPSSFSSFDRANVQWRTSRRSNSAIFYSLDKDAIDALTVDVLTKAILQDEDEDEDEAGIDSVTVDEAVRLHQISLANLPVDTTLYVRVRSADVSGNAVVSPPFTIVTTSVEDDVPPIFVRPPGVLFISDTEAKIFAKANEPTTMDIQYATTPDVYEDDTGTVGILESTTDPRRLHTFFLTGLTSGTEYFYKIKATDFAGNGPTTNTGQLSFVTRTEPDAEGPRVFGHPIPVGITNNSVIIIWRANEVHSAEVILNKEAIGGGAKQANDDSIVVEGARLRKRRGVSVGNLEPGTTYRFKVRMTDPFGNTSLSEHALMVFTTRAADDVDDEAPVIVKGPVVRNITSESARVKWLLNELSDCRISWATDAEFGATGEYTSTIEEATSGIVCSIALTDLTEDTEYHFGVESADNVGNVVKTDPAGGILGLSFDHTFRTRPAAAAVAPSIIEGPVVDIKDDFVIIRFRTDQDATSLAEVGALPASKLALQGDVPVFGEASQIVVENTDELATDHSVEVTGLTPGQQYVFQVTSTNAAGLEVTSTDPLTKLQVPGGFGSFTTDTDPDTQFPVITAAPKVVASTTSSLTIEWGTDENSNSQLSFGDSEDDLGDSEISGDNVTTHRVVLTKLTAGTTYAYQAGATDVSGNGATLSKVAFGSTPSDIDISAPVISVDASVIYKNDRQATIGWETSEAADAEVAFGTSEESLDQIRNDPDFNTAHTITLTNLDADQLYYYRVSSKDQSNNGPVSSDILSFQTDADPDVTSPVISNVVATPGDSTATITWDTDEVSDSAVLFGAAGGSLDFNVGDASDVTSHVLILTNLTPDTDYSFQVESVDRAGNPPSEGTVTAFKTFAAGAVPAPDPPDQPTATEGSGIVSLAWEASASSGVVGYIVEREAGDGSFSPIATLGVATSYVDNNVDNDVSYSYQIRSLAAQQLSGDPSLASDVVTPAVDKGLDTPTLALIQGDPLSPTIVINNSSGSGLSYTFHLASSSDYSDALSLEAGLSAGAGTGSGDPAGVTAWTVDRTLEDGTTYYYRVKAGDGTFESAFLEGQITVDATAAEFPGDLDGDFKVGFFDFLGFVGAFEKSPGDSGFDLAADLTGDGAVGFFDFLALIGLFDKQYVKGESGTKPVAVVKTYGIDVDTKLQLVRRPSSSTQSKEFIADITVSNTHNLKGYGVTVKYDPDHLKFISATDGGQGILKQDGRLAEIFGVLRHVSEEGEVLVASAMTQGSPVAGDGIAARLHFEILDGNPRGGLIEIVEGLLIDDKLGVNAAQNLGARLSLVPDEFALEPNFPNPFNPETTIQYAVPEAGRVSIRVYNILGQEVATLVDEDHLAGYYVLRWGGLDAQNRPVASGIYLTRMAAEGFQQIHKMLLLK